MGIKRAAEKAPKTPVKPFVTLYLDTSTPEHPDAKEELRFRQPHIPDLMKTQERMAEIGKYFPGADNAVVFKVAFFTQTYIREEGETDTEIADSFMTLADQSEYVFDDLMEQYGREYPLFFGWLGRQAEALLPQSETSTTTA